MNQVFPLHFCILPAMKNWTLGRMLGTRLVPQVTIWGGSLQTTPEHWLSVLDVVLQPWRQHLTRATSTHLLNSVHWRLAVTSPCCPRRLYTVSQHSLQQEDTSIKTSNNGLFCMVLFIVCEFQLLVMHSALPVQDYERWWCLVVVAQWWSTAQGPLDSIPSDCNLSFSTA